MSNKKENSFEESLSRLQEISDLLESGETGLDESLKLYEEGIKLSKTCYDKLKNADLKVTELKKQIESDVDQKIEPDE